MFNIFHILLPKKNTIFNVFQRGVNLQYLFFIFRVKDSSITTHEATRTHRQLFNSCAPTLSIRLIEALT